MKNFAITTAALCLSLSCSLFAQTEKKSTTNSESMEVKKSDAGMSAPMTKQEEDMMKVWSAYATPGEAHRMMSKDNGTWNEEMTMWMAPGAKPTKNKATCNNMMILGDRYQQSMHHGEFNGMPFEGISTMGYDNAKKKYVSTWIDNMGTGIMMMEGTYDPATKTIHSMGKEVDPATGKEMSVREDFTLVDANTQLMKMYMTPVGGKEYQTMEIKFTRNQ